MVDRYTKPGVESVITWYRHDNGLSWDMRLMRLPEKLLSVPQVVMRNFFASGADRMVVPSHMDTKPNHQHNWVWHSYFFYTDVNEICLSSNLNNPIRIRSVNNLIYLLILQLISAFFILIFFLYLSFIESSYCILNLARK